MTHEQPPDGTPPDYDAFNRLVAVLLVDTGPSENPELTQIRRNVIQEALDLAALHPNTTTTTIERTGFGKNDPGLGFKYNNQGELDSVHLYLPNMELLLEKDVKHTDEITDQDTPVYRPKFINTTDSNDVGQHSIPRPGNLKITTPKIEAVLTFLRDGEILRDPIGTYVTREKIEELIKSMKDLDGGAFTSTSIQARNMHTMADGSNIWVSVDAPIVAGLHTAETPVNVSLYILAKDRFIYQMRTDDLGTVHEKFVDVEAANKLQKELDYNKVGPHNLTIGYMAELMHQDSEGDGVSVPVSTDEQIGVRVVSVNLGKRSISYIPCDTQDAAEKLARERFMEILAQDRCTHMPPSAAQLTAVHRTLLGETE